MLKSASVLLAIAGAIAIPGAASATVALQNVQVYQWGYAQLNGATIPGSNFSVWSGLAHSNHTASNDGSLTHIVKQVGTTSDVGSMESDGYLGGTWRTATPGTFIGQSYSSTRFTVNEILKLRIDGEIQAQMGNTSYNARFNGTQWTRARIMDFVTGALVFSRTTRADSDKLNMGGLVAWTASVFDTQLLLLPGRYNLVLDSYFETSPPSDIASEQGTLAGWGESGEKVWEVDLGVRRPELWELPGVIVPEPASASVVLAGLLLIGSRTRRERLR